MRETWHREGGRQLSEITSEVDRIFARGEALDRFRGKEMLKEFYRRHIAPRNVSYTALCLDLAKRVGKDNALASRLDSVFDKLLS